MSDRPPLTLYHYWCCPFCMMVERVIDELGLEVARLDILEDDQACDDLISATGRRTVPVLKIGDGPQARWMPESRYIIRWLQQQPREC